jgi:phage tail-like protein
MRGGLAVDDPAGLADEPGAYVLVNPHPLAETLPGVYRDSWMDEYRRTAREPFGTRFISALDDVLAPVLATLDSFDGYLDPGTTSEDFLVWLGQWVAASVDAGWSEDRRRAFVARASELYRRRGTALGLHDHVEIHTGGTVEIVENGASSWSAKAEGKLPGSPEPVVIVRVVVDDPDSIDKTKLEAIVHASKPAHVVHRVEILATAQRTSRKAKTGTTDVAEAVADAAASIDDEPTPKAAADTDVKAEAPVAEPPAKPEATAKKDVPPKATDDPDPAT